MLCNNEMHAICNSIEKKISKLQNAKETIFPNKDYYFHDGIQCYLEQ